jgi:hypothetical protein
VRLGVAALEEIQRCSDDRLDALEQLAMGDFPAKVRQSISAGLSQGL